MTNANVTVSCDPRNEVLVKQLENLKDIDLHIEDSNVFKRRTDKESPWNIIEIPTTFENPLVGQFISLIFPLGHIKSTKPKDKEFLDLFSKSDKWLRVKKM